ncbi:hypothetical protein TNCV_3311051 [Trichonephila clavipes]|nr:hypothetical protein TNCV_3311051 [Trichonephila clavipes]
MTYWIVSILNLSLCDFWLFPKMKRPIKGSRFLSKDEIMQIVTAELKHYSKRILSEVFWTVEGMLGLACERVSYPPGGTTAYQLRHNSINCQGATWSPKMMPTWLYRQHSAVFPLNRPYNGVSVTDIPFLRRLRDEAAKRRGHYGS